MTLVIDTVPNVFKPLRVRNTEHASFFFPFDGTRRKRELKKAWKLFIKRCADESCIAPLGKKGRQIGTQTHHPETLGNAFTYGITELFLILLV